jgi:hypothetical protein
MTAGFYKRTKKTKKKMSLARKKYLKSNNIKMNGNKNPNWKGGIMYDKKRKLIYSPNHPRPDFLKKYCYEYRLIVEKKLGRYLKPNEIVHHKNGDITDNRLKNLQLMTQKEHINLHRKQGDMNLKYKQKHNRDKKGRFID